MLLILSLIILIDTLILCVIWGLLNFFNHYNGGRPQFKNIF